MEISINDKSKYVSIWLTRAESADAALREDLKPLFEQYRQQKYRVVLLESGSGDLVSLTQGLLRHNLELLAKKES